MHVLTRIPARKRAWYAAACALVIAALCYGISSQIRANRPYTAASSFVHSVEKGNFAQIKRLCIDSELEHLQLNEEKLTRILNDLLKSNTVRLINPQEEPLNAKQAVYNRFLKYEVAGSYYMPGSARLNRYLYVSLYKIDGEWKISFSHFLHSLALARHPGGYYAFCRKHQISPEVFDPISDSWNTIEPRRGSPL